MVLGLLGTLLLAGSQDPAGRGPALRAVFEQLAEQGFSGAVLVAAGDEILLRAAAGLADRAHGRLNRPETVFDAGSITKSFTAAAILKLAEQGQLSPGDRLERFFPDVPREKRAIRLHDLLTHTSGLPADVPVGSATQERAEFLQACWQAKLAAKPGAEYVYNNAGYGLLAAVVEVVAGEPFEGFVARELFLPAGLEASAFLGGSGIDGTRTARGYEGSTAHGPAEEGWYSWGLRGAGGVLSTVDDLCRWARALAGEQVLSARWRELLATEHVAGYGYGWQVRTDPGLGKVIEHGGSTRGFEGWLAHYLERDFTLVVLCNGRGMRDAMRRGLVEAALGAAPAATTLPRERLLALAGEYECEGGGRITVSTAGAGLQLEPDLAAVLALEFGAPVKLEQDKALAARARKLAELLGAGDARGLEPLLSDRWPGWNQRMVAVWRGWLEERGELRELEVLGSKEERTLVRLVHERRTVIWTLGWEGGVLSGWSLQGRLPEGAVYLPLSTREFQHRELERPGPVWKLTFAEEGGRVRGFALVGTSSLQARRFQ